MAITNRERIERTLELLCEGLKPFIIREFRATYATEDEAIARLLELRGPDALNAKITPEDWDVSVLLKIMSDGWREVFSRTLGPAERGFVGELRGHRNGWAHQKQFSSNDALRVIDTAGRLLNAILAPQAEELDKMRRELNRLVHEEEARSERRRNSTALVEGAPVGHMKAWREIVTPHQDVASGRFQQAEFAADLWQVHLGEGADEYRDAAHFFQRTFLTASLKQMLVGAVRRLSGQGGDPVVQLQTNFGGGKTHSMLALYHLFKSSNPDKLLGVDEVLSEAGVANVPDARVVVLVGNKISPGNPSIKADGTVVKTLWGELAYQLGGPAAFERVRADDERATSPGDKLRELFNEYGPCLILIDEWVAYARQLHDTGDLPGGNFDTQFSFAQVLTESAKLATNCLLVISLPASDGSGAGHAIADNVEVGGQRGREALDRLQNVVGRVESSWRPATAEEGFEIVRRRLFEPITDPQHFVDRDVAARAFAELYRAHKTEFPAECAEAGYEARIKAAYPIHPEIFDRLYSDWSTLVKFQRTRGVLRLMASVIHTLWENGDKNPLILPSLIPIDNPRVQFELTRYLADSWTPIIEKDVDGPNSLPLAIERSAPNLAKNAVVRRVARTVYLGSAPLAEAAHRGLEDRRIKLGCVMPGEEPGKFGDALRRLANSATYLYQDGNRYWYSTQPTLIKVAEDRAEGYRRDADSIAAELERRLRHDLKQIGDFSRVHPIPDSGADVPDERDARLVVLGTHYRYTKSAENLAEAQARSILEMRGNAPRLFRNALVFLAPDSARVQELEEAVCRYLAWKSILDDKDDLVQNNQQLRQAQTQLASAESTLVARLPETYHWLLVPRQSSATSPIEIDVLRLTGTDALSVRASKKLRGEEALLTGWAPTELRKSMDEIPLWRGDHIALHELSDYFAQFLYLQRLRDPNVLLRTIQAGLERLLCDETFAFADSYDAALERYVGLRVGNPPSFLEIDSPCLLVKPDVAMAQMEAESPTAPPTAATSSGTSAPLTSSGGEMGTVAPAKPVNVAPTRFHGSVSLNASRVGLDASVIAAEILAHLTTLRGAEVGVTLDIVAEMPAGAPENVVRTVTENCRALKFESSTGFEAE